MSTVVVFKYDPFGRRIEKEVAEYSDGVHTDSSVITYVYAGEDIIQEIVTSGGNKGKGEVNSYVHGPGIDEPLAVEQKGNIYFYHADGLGSITALTDERGKVVQSYEYTSFGQPKRHANVVKHPYTYTGREWDEEIDLYFYRARYYDPESGRFISEDPIGFAGGDVNLYGYVNQNPVNWIDPSGLTMVGPIFDDGRYDNNMSSEESNCIYACMADRGLVMNIPGLNLLPFDLSPIQTLAGYDVPFISGGASDAAASASEVNARTWKGVNSLSGSAKILAKGSGVLNLAIAAWDLGDDLAECRMLCKKCRE